MAGLRAVMVTIPPIFGDIIRHLAAESGDLDIVAELRERDDLAGRLSAIAPDIVIFGLRHDETEAAADRLPALLPAASFIVLSNDGRDAFGYALDMRKTTFADVSPAVLIDFLRKAVTARDQ
jgi:DNA-binding NarL/FixJ family response regulator